MPFLGNIGKAFSDFTQDIANQTKTLADTTKLNQQVREEQSKLDNLYTQLGYQYYQRLRAEGQVPPEADSFLFASIGASIEAIDTLNKKIAMADGTQFCSKCGAAIKPGGKFCPACGAPADGSADTQA